MEMRLLICAAMKFQIAADGVKRFDKYSFLKSLSRNPEDFSPASFCVVEH